MGCLILFVTQAGPAGLLSFWVLPPAFVWRQTNFRFFQKDLRVRSDACKIVHLLRQGIEEIDIGSEGGVTANPFGQKKAGVGYFIYQGKGDLWLCL